MLPVAEAAALTRREVHSARSGASGAGAGRSGVLGYGPWRCRWRRRGRSSAAPGKITVASEGIPVCEKTPFYPSATSGHYRHVAQVRERHPLEREEGAILKLGRLAGRVEDVAAVNEKTPDQSARRYLDR